MLPGFRFLFAAIMLSMSLLIFALGAAALFRAAHESFASNSSWRPASDVPFAQRPETTLPVLATLRVEPATQKGPHAVRGPVAPARPTAAITEPATTRPTTIEPVTRELTIHEPITSEPMPREPVLREPVTRDQVATVPPVETPPAKIAGPAGISAPTPVADNPPAPETAPAAPVTSDAASAEQTTATVAASDAASARSEPALVQPQLTVPPGAPAAPAVAPETGSAMAKIATLGGPPVDITDAEPEAGSQADQAQAKPDPGELKKREQARRAMRQRRLAERARLLAQQQFPPNPFAPPQAYLQRQPSFAGALPRR